MDDSEDFEGWLGLPFAVLILVLPLASIVRSSLRAGWPELLLVLCVVVALYGLIYVIGGWLTDLMAAIFFAFLFACAIWIGWFDGPGSRSDHWLALSVQTIAVILGGFLTLLFITVVGLAAVRYNARRRFPHETMIDAFIEVIAVVEQFDLDARADKNQLSMSSYGTKGLWGDADKFEFLADCIQRNSRRLIVAGDAASNRAIGAEMRKRACAVREFERAYLMGGMSPSEAREQLLCALSKVMTKNFGSLRPAELPGTRGGRALSAATRIAVALVPLAGALILRVWNEPLSNALLPLSIGWFVVSLLSIIEPQTSARLSDLGGLPKFGQ